jgi:hypothetical protein
MSVITTLDISDMTPEEFGYRVTELWDRKEGFEEFLEGLVPSLPGAPAAR